MPGKYNMNNVPRFIGGEGNTTPPKVKLGDFVSSAIAFAKSYIPPLEPLEPYALKTWEDRNRKNNGTKLNP